MLYAQRVLPQTQLTPDGGKHTVAAGLVALYKNLGWGAGRPNRKRKLPQYFPIRVESCIAIRLCGRQKTL